MGARKSVELSNNGLVGSEVKGLRIVYWQLFGVLALYHCAQSLS